MKLIDLLSNYSHHRVIVAGLKAIAFSGVYTMSFRQLLVGAAAFISLSAEPANATVYALVGQGIPPADATGTITTDGTIGVLSLSDLTAVDIVVADGIATSELTIPNSIILKLTGDDFTATSDGLYFNYGGTRSSIFQIAWLDPVSGLASYCIGGRGSCYSAAGVEIVVGSTFYLGPDQSDEVLVATTGSAVPEPTSWALLMLGFGSVGVTLRSARRKLASVTA